MRPLSADDEDDWGIPLTQLAWFPPHVSLPIPEVEWAPRDRVIGTLHLPDGISYELIDEGRPFGFARALEGAVTYEFSDDPDEE